MEGWTTVGHCGRHAGWRKWNQQSSWGPTVRVSLEAFYTDIMMKGNANARKKWGNWRGAKGVEEDPIVGAAGQSR
eukprot:9257009-Alexandrium_andersonii.AAC.1